MTYKEIAFLANFAQKNDEVIFTLAANLHRPEDIIRFIFKDLEDEAIAKMNEEANKISKHKK